MNRSEQEGIRQPRLNLVRRRRVDDGGPPVRCAARLQGWSIVSSIAGRVGDEIGAREGVRYERTQYGYESWDAGKEWRRERFAAMRKRRTG